MQQKSQRPRERAPRASQVPPAGVPSPGSNSPATGPIIFSTDRPKAVVIGSHDRSMAEILPRQIIQTVLSSWSKPSIGVIRLRSICGRPNFWLTPGLLPTTVLGLAFVPDALFTGQVRRVDGVLEVHGWLARFFLTHCTLLDGGASAMTLGHVVIARSPAFGRKPQPRTRPCPPMRTLGTILHPGLPSLLRHRLVSGHAGLRG